MSNSLNFFRNNKIALKLVFFSLIASVGIFVGCKKEEKAYLRSNVIAGGSAAPGQFVATLNGQPFSTSATAATVNPTGYTISGSIIGGSSARTVGFGITCDTANPVGTYVLKVVSPSVNGEGHGFYIDPNSITYVTDASNTGTATVTNYDAARKLMSGTYSFKAKKQSGTDIVTVANGSFNDIPVQ